MRFELIVYINLQLFKKTISMAAILKFKMEALDVNKKLAPIFFLISEVSRCV